MDFFFFFSDSGLELFPDRDQGVEADGGERLQGRPAGGLRLQGDNELWTMSKRQSLLTLNFEMNRPYM